MNALLPIPGFCRVCDRPGTFVIAWGDFIEGMPTQTDCLCLRCFRWTCSYINWYTTRRRAGSHGENQKPTSPKIQKTNPLKGGHSS